MTPDLLERVFDLFVQGDRSLDRAQGGLGIGLTLVRSAGRDARRLGAGVQRGAGARERAGGEVAAGAARPEPHRSPRGRRRRAPAAGAPMRVLVVDDNVDAAKTLGAALEVGRPRGVTGARRPHRLGRRGRGASGSGAARHRATGDGRLRRSPRGCAPRATQARRWWRSPGTAKKMTSGAPATPASTTTSSSPSTSGKCSGSSSRFAAADLKELGADPAHLSGGPAPRGGARGGFATTAPAWGRGKRDSERDHRLGTSDLADPGHQPSRHLALCNACVRFRTSSRSGALTFQKVPTTPSTPPPDGLVEKHRDRFPRGGVDGVGESVGA